MYKKILYPFSPDRTFHSGYTWAMELAARMNAVLFFFTTVPYQRNKAEFVDDLSHILLEAQGNYLQRAPANSAPARTERHIGEGEFPFSLSTFVKKNRFDIVVIDPVASSLPQSTLDYVVENSDGVIVLQERDVTSYEVPSPASHESEKKIVDTFYDVLHNAELYKLPDNFFTTLGQDKRLFNYLRSFFKRKETLADRK